MLLQIIFYFFLLQNQHGAMVNQGKQYVIVDEEFANRPFGVILLPENIRSVVKSSFSIEKKGIVNIHSGKMDSLIIFKNSKSEFSFYKSESKTFFQTALIRDPSIRLLRGIRVGQSLDSFKLVFKINKSLTTSVIVITNEEEYTKHKFYFKHNRLEKVELNAVVD